MFSIRFRALYFGGPWILYEDECELGRFSTESDAIAVMNRVVAARIQESVEPIRYYDSMGQKVQSANG